MTKYLANCFCMAFVVLLLGIPSHAFALLYTMDFGSGSTIFSDSYVEDGFSITAVDSGDGDSLFFVLATPRDYDLLANSTDRNMFIHTDRAKNVDEVLFGHFGLGFDLMSLDIEVFTGQTTILSSSGASLYLDDFGLGTAYFDSVGWQNITSFSILTSGSIAIDNVIFENPPISAVPEPGTFFLLSAGLMGLLGYGAHRKRKNV